MLVVVRKIFNAFVSLAIVIGCFPAAATCTYSLLNKAAKESWRTTLTELGFNSADFENLKRERIIIYGGGFPGVEFPRIAPAESVPRPADIVLHEPSLKTSLGDFGKELEKMVAMTAPGGEIRIYGLPLRTIRTVTDYIQQTYGEKVEAAVELKRHEGGGPESTILIIGVRPNGKPPPEPTDKSYGTYW